MVFQVMPSRLAMTPPVRVVPLLPPRPTSMILGAAGEGGAGRGKIGREVRSGGSRAATAERKTRKMCRPGRRLARGRTRAWERGDPS